jgi:PqqD family protein of HPr-rel-A system
VLHHRPSGKTHFVNAATYQLLEQVLRQPRDVATATAELAERQAVAPDVEFGNYVAGLLPRLEELGLVERA